MTSLLDTLIAGTNHSLLAKLLQHKDRRDALRRKYWQDIARCRSIIDTGQYAAKPGQTESPMELATGVENPTVPMQASAGPKPLDSDVPLESGEASIIYDRRELNLSGWNEYKRLLGRGPAPIPIYEDDTDG